MGMLATRHVSLNLASLARTPQPTGVRPLKLLLPAEPVQAGDIYRGRFTLAGHTVESGPEGPFARRAEPEPWLRALHGFGWLRYLASSGGQLPRVHARGLVMDWIDQRCSRLAVAGVMATQAERVTSWLVHAPFLLAGAPATFERAFLAQLDRQARNLASLGPANPDPDARIDAACAYALAALSLKGFEGYREAAFDRLADELRTQILPDGGHVSRSPQRLVRCLTKVLPVRLAVEEFRVELPQQLAAIIDRMGLMTRFFLLGDGGIATFNGVSEGEMATVAALTSTMPDSDGIPARAPYSGFVRLASGQAVLLMDGGVAPPTGVNALAAPAPGAFELSDGPDRIVVNCGAPASAAGEWAKAARLTAAHSTAELGALSAATILSSSLLTRLLGSPALLGLERADVELDAGPHGTLVRLVHDGYAGRFGCWHERRLFMTPCGRDIRGEDRFHLHDSVALLPDATIRFHLHPEVGVRSEADGTVLLTTKTGTAWGFTVRGGELSIEESIYLVDRPHPQATRQIVVRSNLARGQRLLWRFKKLPPHAP
jgi:uncharacterized heparinase superfamily protein